MNENVRVMLVGLAAVAVASVGAGIVMLALIYIGEWILLIPVVLGCAYMAGHAIVEIQKSNKRLKQMKERQDGFRAR